MEFTQPLGAGLGLAVRINNQYSHPVCTGRHTNAYATINDMREKSWENQLLTQECSCGYWGIRGNRIPCGQRADNASNQVTVDDVMWKSHKMIAQINCTNELHKTIVQYKMTSHPRMEMMNDVFRCSRATQVCMEDLRLVNLTEKHPSQRDE